MAIHGRGHARLETIGQLLTTSHSGGGWQGSIRAYMRPWGKRARAREGKQEARWFSPGCRMGQ